MPQVPPAIFKVWLIDEQRARWLWVVVVVVVVGTLGCGISFALAGRPLLGVLLGPVLALGVAFWYGQRILLPATVQASPTQLTIEQEKAGICETLPFKQLAYCIYTTYRAPVLQIYPADGPRIRLRARGGTTDLEALAALVKNRLPGSL